MSSLLFFLGKYKLHIFTILFILTIFMFISRYLATQIDITDPKVTDGQISPDLVALPQDLIYYANRAGFDKALLDDDKQQKLVEKRKEKFFKAWNNPEVTISKEEFKRVFLGYKMSAGYAENLRPYTEDNWNKLVTDSDGDKYPSQLEKGIVVANTNLRIMPTSKPFFLYPRLAGEGYPFDMFQNSSVAAGTPALITHKSSDGLWSFVETSVASGWMLSRDVAEIDSGLQEVWQKLPLGTITSQDVVLKEGDLVLGHVNIGASFPIYKEYGNSFDVMIPQKGYDGKAFFRIVSIDKNDIISKPMKLTPMNIATIGNKMMGQLYGWGGMNEDRDCSSTMQDLFAVFGIWLPRNSGGQGNTGTVIKFGDISPTEKEKIIVGQGVPFFSLVGFKGHIVLYLGNDDKGRPNIFHNVWGLLVSDAHGNDSRAIIGKAVVTTMRPERDLRQAINKEHFLSKSTTLALLSGSADDKEPEKAGVIEDVMFYEDNSMFEIPISLSESLSDIFAKNS